MKTGDWVQYEMGPGTIYLGTIHYENNLRKIDWKIKLVIIHKNKVKSTNVYKVTKYTSPFIIPDRISLTNYSPEEITKFIFNAKEL